MANAYCWFDFNFSHDSSALISGDAMFHAAIGRYLDPIVLFFRGELFSPFLLGIVSIIYLSVSTYLVSKIFKLKNRFSLILLSGLLSANSVITFITATYVYELDLYMLALMLSIIGAYTCMTYKKGWIASIILFAASLGLYQSYWQVAIIIFMLSSVIDALSKVDYKEIIGKLIKYIICLVLGLVLYLIGYKIALIIYNIEPMDNYNGLSLINNLLNMDVLLKSFIGTYRYFFHRTVFLYIFNDAIVSILIILSGVSSIVMILSKAVKNKLDKPNWVLLILLGIFLPLGGNIIYLITSGLEHGLMTYSFIFIYVFFICIMENIEFKDKVFIKIKKIFNYLILITCGFIIINSIIYSNQAYMKKHAEYDQTYATLNRVIDRMEQFEGYEVGKTKVLFAGRLENSNLTNRNYFYDYKGTGLESSFSVTYPYTYDKFINNVMSYPMDIVTDETLIEEYQNKEEVLEMEAFPSKESLKMIDGMLIVKLSE